VPTVVNEVRCVRESERQICQCQTSLSLLDYDHNSYAQYSHELAAYALFTGYIHLITDNFVPYSIVFDKGNEKRLTMKFTFRTYQE